MPNVTPNEVTVALTWARTQPLEVAEELRKRIPLYKGKDYSPPERKGTSVVTKEGKAAVEEAIAYLEKLEPLGPVGEASEPGLGVAAEDHVSDIGFTGAVSHNSSDGTNGAQRVGRYGSFRSFGECLWYGSDLADARCMVLDLIVDDGVESRGHRNCVYNHVFDTVGCAYGPHATFGRVSAMEFAMRWQPDAIAIEARQAAGPIKVSGQEAAKKGVSTQWKVIGTCPVCKEPIRGGAVVEIEKLGGKLHKACFNCAECSKPLSGVPFNVHQQVPYCKECYFEKHGEKCAGCGKPISGGMVKCTLGVFHLECVVCSQCSKSIGKNTFSTEGGVISCQACASQSLLGGSGGGLHGGSVADRRGPRQGGPGGAAVAKAKAPSPPRTPSAQGSRAGSHTASAKVAPTPPRTPPTGSRAASASALGKAAPASSSGIAGKAAGKAVAKPKAKQKISLSKAGASVVGLGMDYANL